MRKKAADLGFTIKLVRKMFGPRHVQNRIYINGHRCQVMTGLRLNPNDSGDREMIDLYAPRTAWAEFVIYVPEPLPNDERPVLIIPTNRLHETPLQTADELNEYADRWDLLRRRGAVDDARHRFRGGETRVAPSHDWSPEVVDRTF